MDVQAAFKITAGVAGQKAVDNLNESVKNLGGYAKSAGLALAGLGSGLGIAVLASQFREFVSAASGLKDVAEITGSTVEKMGALKKLAGISGNDFDSVEKAIVKMNKALSGSDDDAKGAAHALQAIGLSIADLRRMDPADAFQRIAEAMFTFEGGVGKTAVAMDIFGKSGAQVIPMLNDMIELGQMVSKITKEQADAAEEYEINVKRLEASKRELYKTISAELLPVANAFVKMLAEANNQTGGLRGEVKHLAEDGSLRTFFMEGARAGAAVLDVLSWVGKAIAQIGESLTVVINDIKTAALIVAQPHRFFTDAGRNEMRAELAARSALAAEANERLAQRWGTMTPFTDSLERQFQQIGKPSPSAPKRSLSGYQSRTPTLLQRQEADPYATEMQSLGREGAKLAWQAQHIEQFHERITSAREAQIAFDVEQGKFKDLTAEQKKNLLEAARSVDKYAESLRQAQAGLEYDKQTEKVRANTRALGESALEREKIAALQDLENRGIREGTELYDQLAKRRIQALEEARAAQGSFTLGLRQGFNDYNDIIANKAQMARDAFVSAFRGMEDALVEFTVTGKLNFSNFARSVIADIARIYIRQSIIAPLLNTVGGMFGFGGSAAAGAAGKTVVTSGGPTALAANGMAFAGGVRAFAAGGVVGSPTLFKFASGGSLQTGLMGEAGPEAIVPLKRGRDGRLGIASTGGGQIMLNVTVNADGSGDGKADGGRLAQFGDRVGQVVREEIIRQKRPGGLLAAA